MSKKLCLVLSALSLIIPSQVFAYGAYYGNGGTYSNGRLSTSTRTRSSRSSTAQARPLSGSRGFSGGGRGGGFSSFGSANTPQATGTIITAEGALVRSPEMFTLKQPTGQPQQWFSGTPFSGIAMDESHAQALGGAGVFMGKPDLAPGANPNQGPSSAAGSGGYGTFFSNTGSAGTNTGNQTASNTNLGVNSQNTGNQNAPSLSGN